MADDVTTADGPAAVDGGSPPPAGRRDLSRLLDPRSIAVVGASPRPDSLAHRLLVNLGVVGYRGAVHLVSPRHREIDGRPCLPDVAALPEPVDVAVVSLPAAQVPDQITALAAAGVRHAVVYSAGFAEVAGAGADLQRRLVRAAVEGGVNVVGPNCMGNLHPVTSACTTFSTVVPHEELRPGPVACVTQSGGIGVVLYSAGVRAGLGFSHVVSTGNEADVTTDDVLDALAVDPHTEVVCVYSEHLTRGRRFLAAARRLLAQGRHVIVLKAGRSGPGAAAVRSHTGALASDWAVTRELFAEAGIVLVETPQQLVTAARLATSLRPFPAGDRLMVLASSGGTAVVAADLAGGHGLTLPAPPAPVADQVRTVLPPFAPVGNPLDVSAKVFHEPTQAARLLDAIATGGGVDALAVVAVLPYAASERLAEALAAQLAACRLPGMVGWLGGSDAVRSRFVARGIPYEDDPARLLDVYARMVAARPRAARAAAAAGAGDAGAPAAGRPGTTRWLTEEVVKARLAAAGLPVPPSTVAATLEEAVGFAAGLGRPVAMKILDTQVPHRAAVGALALSLTTAEEIARAWRRVHDAAAAHGASPSAPVLVEPMVTGGPELFVGYQRDTGFGPVLAVGIGGSLAERKQAEGHQPKRLGEGVADWLTRRVPVLSARLGERPRRAVVELLERVAAWCLDQPRLVSLDLNPVTVSPDGPMIVDALGEVEANYDA